MLILLEGDTLELLTSSTADVRAHVSYVDKATNGDIEAGRANVTVAAITTTTLVTGVADIERTVEYVSVYNADDTDPVDVLLVHNDGSVEVAIRGRALQPDDSLSFSGNEQGEKGETGDTGPPGAAGTNGTNGTNGAAGATGAAGADGPSEDFLLNGNGQVAQDSPGSIGDISYGHDQWYAMVQTGAIAWSTLADVRDGMPSAMRLTQSQASAQRMGYAQPLEAGRVKRLRGQSVTFGGVVRCSISQAIRFALIGWTGTDDTITKDVVADWTNGTFTPGNFFTSTTTTVEAIGSITPAANTLTDFAVTATLGSTFKNLVAFVWTEGTLAQNATLDFVAALKRGNTVAPLVPRPVHEDLRQCQRFYYKDLPAIMGESASVGAGATTAIADFNWPTRMRVDPTVALPTWATAGAGTPTVNTSTKDSLTIQALSTGGAGTRVVFLQSSGNLISSARL